MLSPPSCVFSVQETSFIGRWNPRQHTVPAAFGELWRCRLHTLP